MIARQIQQRRLVGPAALERGPDLVAVAEVIDEPCRLRLGGGDGRPVDQLADPVLVEPAAARDGRDDLLVGGSGEAFERLPVRLAELRARQGVHGVLVLVAL